MSSNRNLKHLFGHLAEFCRKCTFLKKDLEKYIKNVVFLITIKNDAFHLQTLVISYSKGIDVY